MRVPYEWLKEFIDITATAEEVCSKLTMIGLEVESVESIEGDVVFEVNITPNRPDCLSMLGIARELSAIFHLSLRMPSHRISEDQPESDFSIEILNPNLCNRYAGRLIKDVRISDSPEWIKKRLEKCGVRAINNVVDITNYVLLEFGHPLHAFDADTIEGKKIKVDIAGEARKIRTLDGDERRLPFDALLIWDSVVPIAIAGIMGGFDTEVTDRTRNVFLESAYFDPVSVRRTSKALNLKTESSYRFERGADIEILGKALDRAAILIKEIAGGTIHKMIDAYPVKYEPQPLEIRHERINRLLGTNLTRSDMEEILNRLGIPAEDRAEAFVVYPPAHRRDIRTNNDVAEEIARIYGYDRISATIPKTPLPAGRIDKKAVNTRKVKEAMRKAGFTEVINYSFMGTSSLDMLSIPDGDVRRKTIAIVNPLIREEGLLRTTLAPALIGNLLYNLDRGIQDIRFFEMSRIFINRDQPLPLEELRLGGIFFKERFPALWREEVPGFFVVKGALEAMFEELKVSEYRFIPSSEPFLQSGQSADIYILDSPVGYVGILEPEIVERLDLKKQKPEVVLFELNLDLFLTFVPVALHYLPIPKYPPVERDIAFVVDESIPSSKIKELIMSYSSEIIEEVSIFDFYRGGNIPEGKKSLAFSITYRSKEKTLTDEEVETIHNSLVNFLIEQTGGMLRK
ncbi:MAG: phenylalanine--tRNA ligase subunit beta [Nitrospirota bacterium]